MRRKLIAGNWKMNMTYDEAVEFARTVGRLIIASAPDRAKGRLTDVVFCVPAPYIVGVKEALAGTGVEVGAQNVHTEDFGAFTGEVSAAMLKSMGVRYCIVGHSERREYFGETDGTVNRKALKMLEHGIVPIVCVGEKLEQRERGVTIELVRMQVKNAFYGVSAEQARGEVIAYEPVWAIGTGKTATKEQAQEVCAAVRAVIGEMYNADVAENIRILYGGSVTADNARELFTMPDIDGGLVGGASVKPDFEKVVNYS